MRVLVFVLTVWVWSNAAYENFMVGEGTLLQPSPEVIADGGTSLPPPPPGP